MQKTLAFRFRKQYHNRAPEKCEQNEIKKSQNFEKKIKKVVDKKNSDCYTKQAAPLKTSEQRGPKSKRKGERKRAEHLENYIVQETKNKPVILRQEHRKMLKLKNET